MCPTIRIDNEVYGWLKSQAEPFDDTPNSVLRRLAKIDPARPREQGASERAEDDLSQPREDDGNRRTPLATGDDLLLRWHITAKQARFHRGGTFFERPVRFPAALCDVSGYVVFESERDLAADARVRVGPKKVNVRGGISSLDRYTQSGDPVR